MVLAAPPRLPESRVDQLVIERSLTTKIYQSFGIPETVAGFSSASGTTSTQGASSKVAKVRKDVNLMDIITFESTLDRYKKFFADAFMVVYEDIFNKAIPKDSIEFLPPKIYERYLKTVVGDEMDEQGEAPRSPRGEVAEAPRSPRGESDGAVDQDKKRDDDEDDSPPKKKKRST
jgi:hypothetical protein